MKITKSKSQKSNCSIWVTSDNKLPEGLALSKTWKEKIIAGFKRDENSFEIQIDTAVVFIENVTNDHEKCRQRGAALCKRINALKFEDVELIASKGNSESLLALAEGLALANYQFLKYFKDSAKRKNSLQKISIFADEVSAKQVTELSGVIDATNISRNLVNEPNSYLSALVFAKEMKQHAEGTGLKVEVLNKKQIESLGMGGILSVNKGSVEPPTFTIITWNPEKPVNKKPIVLVGKGVVYDTGGLSLKPTANSMDEMKCDMAGGAAVFGAMLAIAANKLSVHVVALIPATDNRPGGAAYAPGDVIQMYDKTTVEVMNTDAEGRLLLADALSFAKKYKPQEVVDLATLTGAAVRAIGAQGIAGMSNDESVLNELVNAGASVYERIVPLPLWEEYRDEIKSEIADLRNMGTSGNAGAQTAAVFLQHFTDYPWAHLDIAGPAFLGSADHYRPKGGTGVGVRLLYNYLKNKK
jgi:leucyl aminopeptidase